MRHGFGVAGDERILRRVSVWVCLLVVGWGCVVVAADAACEDYAFHIFSKLLQILVEYSSIILIFSDILMPE